MCRPLQERHPSTNASRRCRPRRSDLVERRRAFDPEHVGDMSGRVAIVVGAGGGLGRACVHRLVADGYMVAACDLDRGKLAAATESLATPCFLREMNVTEEHSVS